MNRTASILHNLGLLVAICSMAGLIAGIVLTSLYGKDWSYAVMSLGSLALLPLGKILCRIAWDIQLRTDS